MASGFSDDSLLRGNPETFECILTLTSSPGGAEGRYECDGTTVWLRLGGLGRGEADFPLDPIGSAAVTGPSSC
jgi:hypothetical protein